MERKIGEFHSNFRREFGICRDIGGVLIGTPKSSRAVLPNERLFS